MEEVPLLPQPLQMNGIPKTMQQMAEDAARNQRSNGPRESPVDSDYQLTATPASTKTRSTTRSSRTTGRSDSTPSAKGKATLRPKPNRKRNRNESPSSVSDSETSRPSPIKRGRDSTATPTPSGRLLRPRALKSTAKIQEEIEQEEAFRRAVAD